MIWLILWFWGNIGKKARPGLVGFEGEDEYEL